MKKKALKRSRIKILILAIGIITGIPGAYAEEVVNKEKTKQELIDLSKTKWQWMADKDVDSLDELFHEESVFVHMGATMNKAQELNTIRSGGIRYKHTEIEETSVRFIVLAKIRLTAVVGGNEVVNPFMVTEAYVPIDGKWKLGSLSFTRLISR